MAYLRWVCVVVLVGLAVRGAVLAVRQYRGASPEARDGGTPVSPARAYLGLLGLTIRRVLLRRRWLRRGDRLRPHADAYSTAGVADRAHGGLFGAAGTGPGSGVGDYMTMTLVM